MSDRPDDCRTELIKISEADLVEQPPSYARALEAFLASEVDSKHTRRAHKHHILEAFRLMHLGGPGELHPNDLVKYREEAYEGWPRGRDPCPGPLRAEKLSHLVRRHGGPAVPAANGRTDPAGPVGYRGPALRHLHPRRG